MDGSIYFCLAGLALGIGVCFVTVMTELDHIKDLIKNKELKHDQD